MTDAGNRETVLWLLRHPEPEASARGRCYGSLDVALSPDGIRQARSVAHGLAQKTFAAIYTSPRQRCTQAAHILAAGRTCPVETIAALRELDFGEFEGHTYDEIAAMYPDLYQQWMKHPTETRFPGGESFPEMRARVIAVTRDLRSRHAGQSIALVTHGGVIRIILADALGMEAAKIFSIGQRYSAINAVRYFGETPIIELVNAEPASIA
jgi:alpha-ribazole phosphatase/probable phosphoglycerate mutase